jgi:hypothetical protein
MATKLREAGRWGRRDTEAVETGAIRLLFPATAVDGGGH